MVILEHRTIQSLRNSRPNAADTRSAAPQKLGLERMKSRQPAKLQKNLELVDAVSRTVFFSCLILHPSDMGYINYECGKQQKG